MFPRESDERKDSANEIIPSADCVQSRQVAGVSYTRGLWNRTRNAVVVLKGVTLVFKQQDITALVDSFPHCLFVLY